MPNWKHEEWCVEQLVSVIHLHHPGCAVTYKMNKHDPPDAWIWIDGQKTGVEVTTIVDERHHSQWRSVDSFIKGIEKDVLQDEVLSGKYLIWTEAPLPRDKDNKNDLKSQILSYLHKHIASTSSQREGLETSEGKFGTIEKWRVDGQVLCCGGGVENCGALVSDLEPVARKIMHDSLESKRKKLEKISNPIILVLCDWLTWTDDRGDYERIIKESSHYSHFRAILLIHLGEADWVKKLSFEVNR